MDEAPSRKKRRIWWLLLPAAVLALGAAAVLLLLANSGMAARYDDAGAILAAYDAEGFGGLSVAPDGTARVELEKEDIYWLCDQLGLLAPLREQLSADPAVTDTGFRISEGKLQVYLGRRLWGAIPLSYRAAMDVELEAGAICLRTESVVLGTRLRPSQSRWPALFREGVRLDLSGTELADEVTAAALEGNTLVLGLRGLCAGGEGALVPDADTLRTMDLFGTDPGLTSGALSLVREAGESLPVSGAQSFAAASGDARTALAEVMSLCREDSRSALWTDAGTLVRTWLWTPLARQAAQRQGQTEDLLAAAQSQYERLLFALREMYRSGSLRIMKTGFVNDSDSERVGADTLSRLPVTAMDSRIVFLSSKSGGGITTEDMPTLESVPASDWRIMEARGRNAVLDLGVVLTTGGGVPVLLHRLPDGTLAIREIREELYVSILVAQETPVVEVDDLPPPADEIHRAAGEGWTGAALLLLPEE